MAHRKSRLHPMLSEHSPGRDSMYLSVGLLPSVLPIPSLSWQGIHTNVKPQQSQNGMWLLKSIIYYAYLEVWIYSQLCFSTLFLLSINLGLSAHLSCNLLVLLVFDFQPYLFVALLSVGFLKCIVTEQESMQMLCKTRWQKKRRTILRQLDLKAFISIIKRICYPFSFLSWTA